MLEPDRERLRSIRTFPSLVRYLRDELDWPIETENFEDLYFEYEPEELGIDPKTAAKIESIKQLRRLVSDQPWGIFFVKFEPKRLPVVALRRILGQLVFNKRATAGRSERPSWNLHDLLFISSYGEGDDRQISLAHFSEDSEVGNLATLKVLGWDGEDTPLYLDHVHRELHAKLRWPADPTAAENWRQTWSSAFTLRHREVITTSKALAIELADLARRIRKKVNAALAVETESGKLRKLMKAFREALIHDLEDDDFADMYAQTIAYGLLSARVSRQSGALVADDAALMASKTSPFLRELMETFLNIGGRKRKANGDALDFDELGINDVVEMLRAANMEAVLRDFGNLNPQEDPVVHFYELFLKEYDAKKRMQRGVFYTPKPVVSYIVRSVHELLQTEFGLEDGLASTVTWGEMKRRFDAGQLPSPAGGRGAEGEGAGEGFAIPHGTDPDSPFVVILDPATGTATFLVEVIDVIHRTMLAKWKRLGHTEIFDVPELWNEYVPTHLLPRLHGYELMMAPYAIAHMKIGLKLAETGYGFQSRERARVYLTNSLEPPMPEFRQKVIEEMSVALAHEARAVNEIKRNQRFTVVIGNPPYAGHSWNLTPELRRIVAPFREIRGKRIKEKGALQLEKSIQDDYIKFFRLGQIHVDRCGIGLLGLVTSHGFLDNPSLRGMRFSVFSSFSRLFVLNMHGNVLRHEKCPDGTPDKNVFDIKDTGVAVSILRKQPNHAATCIEHAHLWGNRDNVKYPWLCSNTVCITPHTAVAPRKPLFLFIPQDMQCLEEYEQGYSIGEVMPIHSKGVVTGRDAFVIDFDQQQLLQRMHEFTDPNASDEELVEKFRLNPTDWWRVDEARRKMPAPKDFPEYVRPLLYRPFDTRVCFYHPAVFMSPRRPVMRHMEPGFHNFVLITSRMTKGETFQHVTVSKGPAEAILLSSKTSNNAIIFPLYLYAGGDDHGPMFDSEEVRRPNVTEAFLRAIQRTTGLRVVDGCGDFRASLGVEDLLHYIVAALHSPTYRARYADPLSRDFPRLPLTSSRDLFRALARIGEELVALHLLESPKLERPITRFVGPCSPEVQRVRYTVDAASSRVSAGKRQDAASTMGTVWIDAPACRKGAKQRPGTVGFKGVPEAVWNFHIGGYQVCHKWLKDRKGRTLSADDIAHYQKIVVALNETIRIMAEIDEVIDQHGGWPGAFVTGPASETAQGKGEKPPRQPAPPKKESQPAEEPDAHPWQMTRGEFHLWRVSQGFANPTENSRLYWQEIKKALAEGKPVQPSVLREYEQLFGPRKG